MIYTFKSILHFHLLIVTSSANRYKLDQVWDYGMKRFLYHINGYGAILHPYLNFNYYIITLKLWYVWIFTSHMKLWMWSFIQAPILINLLVKKVPENLNMAPLWVSPLTVPLYYHPYWRGSQFNKQIVSSGIEIPIINTRRSWDRLIFIMETPTARWHFYVDADNPCSAFLWIGV